MKIFIRELFFLSILITLISQVPQILEMNIGIYLQLIWVLLLIALFATKSIQFKKKLNRLFLLVFYLMIYVVAMDVFTGKSYIDTPHYINMLKSFFILSISFYVAPFISEKKFNSKLTFIALFGGLVLTFALYKYSFSVGFDITSLQYAYGSKNSVSQIILSCLIIVLFLFTSKNPLLKIIRLLFIFFALYILFLLKSRATILGLVFVLIVIFLQSSNKKLKYSSLLLLSTATIMLFLKEGLLNVVYSNILLGNREGDLNNITSGRVDFFIEFPNKFIENIWFGHGNYFSESFPLSNLLEYGIVGSFFVFIFVLQPIIFYKKHLTLSNSLHLTFLLLILTYYFNGLVEEQSPLGPGSKNFFLWLIFGYLLQKHLITKQKKVVI